MWPLVVIFAVVCGLYGEGFEVLRLRWAGIAMPGLGLRLTLLIAYAGLAAVAWLVARLVARRWQYRLAAALFAAMLAVPWVNFEFLPAAGSLRSVIGTGVAALVAGSLGWLLAGVPRAATLLAVVLAIGVNWQAAGADAPRRTDAPRSGLAGRLNLVVVLIDTLRADHLGVYGYERPTSPRIDGIARDSVVFERAIAQAAWTKPSVASLFTGRFVHAHGVIRSRDVLAAGLPTLATALDDAGYETAAFSGNPWITPEFRFDRGFDHFESGRAMGPQLTNLYRAVRRCESLLRRLGMPLRISNLIFRWAGRSNTGNAERDEAQNAEVRRWLAAADQQRPFFLYVHLIGPHDPYDPPERFAVAFARSPQKAPRLPPPRVQTVFESAEAMDPAELERLIDQYDAAIAHSDTLVGEIYDDLERLGLLTNTVFVVTADHGEEFYEHRNWRHGNQLYDEVVRVPLLMRIPGLPAGRRSDPAMLVDLFPTLLKVLEIEGVEKVDGRPLFPPPEAVDQVTFSEHWWFQGGDYVARAVGRNGLKLMSARDDRSGRANEELYDLRRDAAERENLVASASGPEVDALRTLASALAGAPAPAAGGQVEGLDSETIERLKRLGYLKDGDIAAGRH